MTTFLGILILVCALFLIVSVLLQSSKNHRMSGVVSGGADTFFGKQKGKTIDAVLSKITAVISVVFCILVLVLYVITARSAKAPEVTDPIVPDDTSITTTVEEDATTEEDTTAEEGATEEAPATEAETEEAPATEGETEEAPAEEAAPEEAAE